MRNLLLPLTLAASLIAHAHAEQGREPITPSLLEGYTLQDEQQLLEKVHATLTSPASVFNAHADLNPLVLALLALEAAEGPRDRVRYRISYYPQILTPDKSALSSKPQPLSLVQVDRFSLGAVIRQDAIDAYGAENVAPASDFAVGPHVSWRFFTQSQMGTRAHILAAGRNELTDAQAQALDCLGNGCLSSALELEHGAAWGEVTEVSATQNLPFATVKDGLVTPAAALELLTQDEFFTIETTEAQPQELFSLSAAPVAVAVIELNLGQDAALDAVMRQSIADDDSLSAIWTRLTAMPSDEGATRVNMGRTTAYECLREPKLPADGGLCL